MPCSVEGCGRSVRGHGLCQMHYARWRRWGDPNVVKKVSKYADDAQCSADDCTDKPKCDGLCEKHYCRLRSHGDTSTVLVDIRPAEERWKDMYEVVDLGHASSCWLWLGKIESQGHGRLRNRRDPNNQSPLAHRFVYEQVVGPIPEGLTLDHVCHNADESCNEGANCRHRRCVNPDHLEPVPLGVNVMRGRTPAAINAAKTHCKYGHPFDDANTLHTPDGLQKRACRKCAAERMRRHRAKKREMELCSQ